MLLTISRLTQKGYQRPIKVMFKSILWQIERYSEAKSPRVTLRYDKHEAGVVWDLSQN